MHTYSIEGRFSPSPVEVQLLPALTDSCSAQVPFSDYSSMDIVEGSRPKITVQLQDKQYNNKKIK